MRRRDFITLLSSAALAAPDFARAQGRVRRIGVLMQFRQDSPEVAAWIAAFQEGLQKLNWVEGRNIRSDYHWGGTDDAALKRFAKEIVASKPDLIISSSSLTTHILKPETQTIPIIFTNIVDPVGQGLVNSLSRPGGNITGFVNLEPSVSGKYVELLKEIAPRIGRIVIFYNPATTPYSDIYLKPFQAAATTLGIEAIAAPVRDLTELDSVMAAQAQKPNTGLIAMPSGFTSGNVKEIAALTLRHKLPMVTTALAGPRAGALLAYGNDINDNYRRAASYVDRILKGEKAGDLPVQFPVKFQMVVNLKTAKTLGLDVPLFFQQRADEVIE
jgi:putative tryptophan/tyrosine transport system substrate-binding protein